MLSEVDGVKLFYCCLLRWRVRAWCGQERITNTLQKETHRIVIQPSFWQSD